jgi:DNA modification methylase
MWLKSDPNSLYPERVLREILERGGLEMPETRHRIILGSSSDMYEMEDESVHLVITSPPYPMIEMWDDLFKGLGCKTYREMYNYLAMIWKECKRVLVEGGSPASILEMS